MRFGRQVAGVCSVVLSLVGVTGCFPIPELPGTFEVATSTVDRVEAAKGSGPAGFADSAWSLSRKADPAEGGSAQQSDAPPGPYGGLLTGMGLDRPPVGERIFLVQFDEQGRMVEVAENRFFLADIYGATVPVGSSWVASTLPGVRFRSASYGVQVGDRVGIAIVVDVSLLGSYVGRAVLYAWGAVANDQLEGMFGYLLDLTGGGLRGLGMIADQYPVHGQQIE
jgi:hypothetical protein